MTYRGIRFGLAFMVVATVHGLNTMVEKLASDADGNTANHVLTIAGDVRFPGDYAAIVTRGFNGAIPGPLFRMDPGETLDITLVNNLDPAHSKECSEVNGEFCETSVTNLHTHGLHVSSMGAGSDGYAKHSDNIFAKVLPNESTEYSFTIPDYHMGGTHWYHPHHHHATALQAGGGAVGMLIVNDPPGYLPEPYASMPEVPLFLSAHNLNTLQAMAISSESVLLEDAADVANANGLATNLFLVNGEIQPTKSITENTWYRFRMVFAAVEQSLELVLRSATGAVCELQLLAKDGVYLPEIPRPITDVVMYPGARADVAIRCTCGAGDDCTAVLGTDDARRRSRRLGRGGRHLLMRGPAGRGAPADAGAGLVENVDFLLLNIERSETAISVALPMIVLQRPCYLVDLQDVDVDANAQGQLNLGGGARVVQWNGVGQSMTYDNVHRNGATMEEWPAITTFTTGSVYEIEVTGANAHPLHIHVNPFQISSMPADMYNNGYFKVGDWHDTLLLSDMGGGANTVSVRVHTDVFPGKAVVHCHILEHEDEGMMAWIDIVGAEGATFDDAESIDHTCYRSAYSVTTGSSSPTSSPSPVASSSPAASSSPSASPQPSSVAPTPAPPGPTGPTSPASSPAPSGSTGSSSPAPSGSTGPFSPAPSPAPEPLPSCRQCMQSSKRRLLFAAGRLPCC